METDCGGTGVILASKNIITHFKNLDKNKNRAVTNTVNTGNDGTNALTPPITGQ